MPQVIHSIKPCEYLFVFSLLQHKIFCLENETNDILSVRKHSQSIYIIFTKCMKNKNILEQLVIIKKLTFLTTLST